MNAIVSMSFGPEYQRLADLTFPTIRRYAERCGAAFITLGRRDYPHVHYEKFQIRELLGCFERIAWIDPDIIIRPDSPNLFDIVPDHKIGAYDESLNHEGRCQGFIDDVGLRLGRSAPQCPYYLNLGVHVQSRCHRELFSGPELIMEGDFPEQNLLNYRILASKTPVHLLGLEFNCMAKQMAQMADIGLRYWKECYFLHHSFQPMEWKLGNVKADLERWGI